MGKGILSYKGLVDRERDIGQLVNKTRDGSEFDHLLLGGEIYHTGQLEDRPDRGEIGIPTPLSKAIDGTLQMGRLHPVLPSPYWPQPYRHHYAHGGPA